MASPEIRVWIVLSDSWVHHRLGELAEQPGGFQVPDVTGWERLEAECVGPAPFPRTMLAPLPAAFPPMAIEFPNDPWEAPDFIQWRGHYFVSHRFRQAADLPSDTAQILPLHIRSAGAAAQAQRYAMLRVLTAKKVMDLKLSRFTRSSFRRSDGRLLRWIAAIDEFVPRADLVAEHDLFWDSENVCTLIATDQLAERVMRSGCTGVEFCDPKSLGVLNGSVRYRAADGVAERFLG